MKMYTTEPTEAIHYIQYEQGEDRWLCTLLLQQGYKIEYCAGADALTFAPETFHDFYIQRRRWSPSTLANIIDLIGSWRITVKMNDNMSVPFMMYQFVLLASSIIAPGVYLRHSSSSSSSSHRQSSIVNHHRHPNPLPHFCHCLSPLFFSILAKFYRTLIQLPVKKDV